MNINMLKAICSAGDKYGSGFKEILQYYNIVDNDLSKITDSMAATWLQERNKNDNS